MIIERGYQPMTKQTKAASLLLAATLLLVPALAGCSKGGQEPKASTTPVSTTGNETNKGNTNSGDEVKDPTEAFRGLDFTWYINYDWATMDPWDQDVTTKYLMDTYDVKAEFIQSGGAATQKLNTIIVSNEYPDLISLDRSADLEKLVQAGVLQPIDEYLEKYPNLVEWAGKDTLNMLRSSDGKNYGFPNWYGGVFGNTGYAINKKIYKELGSPKLETFDDLENYLRQVKAAYPDVVPLEPGVKFQAGDIIYGGFGENRPHTFSRDLKAYNDGTGFKSIFQDEAFKESLVFSSRLFRDKLATQDAFTQKEDQMLERLNNGGAAVVGLYNIYQVEAPHNLLAQQDPEAGYQIIAPFHKSGVDPSKVKPATLSTLGWNVSVITKNAKEPEKLFAFLDWFTGNEGQQIAKYGPKGLLWDEADADGVPIPNETYKTMPKEELDKLKLGTINWVANSSWLNKTNELRVSKYEPQEAWSFDRTGGNEIMKEATLNINQYEKIMPAPESEEGIIVQQVKDIYDQMYANAIFAKSDEEVLQLIQKADEQANKLGYDKVLTYITNKWQENVKNINN
jgi:putative aldouronate transport system substrate-binding protein